MSHLNNFAVGGISSFNHVRSHPVPKNACPINYHQNIKGDCQKADAYVSARNASSFDPLGNREGVTGGYIISKNRGDIMKLRSHD